MPSLQLVAELPAHADPAWQVAFNPSRPLLASCSTDRTVRIWSYTLPPPSSSATTPHTHPHVHGESCNHDHAHDADSDVNETLPKADDPKPVFSLNQVIQTEHKRTVRSLGWAPGGRAFATGSFDSSVGVWEEVDAEDSEVEEDGEGEGVYRPGASKEGSKESGGHEWECVTTLEGHESECKSVGWSAKGGLLASCSRDKSVWVWEVQPDSDFECIAVMMEHTQDVKCISWHPQEEILASASYDSFIQLYFDDPDGDWCSFQKLHPSLPPSSLSIPHTQPDDVPFACASPSLIHAMTPSDAERAAQEGLEVPRLEEDETVWCLAWSPDGRVLASGGDGGGIRLWTKQGRQMSSPYKEAIHTVAHTSSPCFSLSWSSGGLSATKGGMGLLCSAGGDGRIIVWQVYLADPADLGTISARPVAATRDVHGVSDVNGVGWCVREGGKGQGMLASCGDDGGVKVWRLVSDCGLH